jgi:hypothetical protein
MFTFGPTAGADGGRVSTTERIPEPIVSRIAGVVSKVTVAAPARAQPNAK